MEGRERIGAKAAPQEQAALEREIQQRLEESDYGGVLESLAKLAERRISSPEAFYAGAYAYFMEGDYERAAAWVDNTLTCAPAHVAARILLARLCILEDRTTEALAVLDGLLETGGEAMTQGEREEIREIVSYYGRTRREMVCRDYPWITAFLGLDGESGGKGIREETVEAAPAGEAPEGGADASAGASALSVARKKADEVMAMPSSVREKARLLCTFAGAWYIDREFPAAELLLKAALRLDLDNAEAWKGLSLMAAEAGERDKALEYASHIQPTDFLFLRVIRGE